MVTNGYQWLPMVTNGYQWLPMVTNIAQITEFPISIASGCQSASAYDIDS